MRTGVRLALDVGDARIGVASCDPGGILATPVRTEARDAGSISRLVALAQELKPVEVVVGIPRSLSGDEGPSAAGVRAFATELARSVRPVPVRLVDERLTTVDAHRALRDSGLDTRRHRSQVDQVAAVMILQTALDQERLSGEPAGEQVQVRKPRHRPGASREETSSA